MQVDVYSIDEAEIENIEAGLVTWWTLKGATCLQSLGSDWEAAGLDPAFKPKPNGLGTALWKAMSSGIFSKYKDDGLLVRKLPGERSAWAVIRERIKGRREEANLDYEPLMSVWLEAGEPAPTYWKCPSIQLDLGMFKDEKEFDTWFEEAVFEVNREFRINQTILDAREMSNWLINVLQNYIHGIGLRKRGGIYYVPPKARALWEEIVNLVSNVHSDCQHTIYTMPVVKGEQMTRAVLDALALEVNNCVSKIESDLTAGIQNRAIQNRKSTAISLDQKLAAYKGLLGDGISLLETKVEDLRASITELELANDF